MGRAKWKQILNQEETPSSFFSVEKDLEIICSRLIVENNKYSEYLKRLLMIQSPDCLDNTTNNIYESTVKKATLASLKKDGYIRIVPQLKLKEHEEMKSFIIITYDNGSPTDGNGYFREGYIMIDILCNFDAWDLGQFRLRPYKIAGYIDILLQNTPLTGLGKLQLESWNTLVQNEDFGGLCLTYRTIHGVDDKLPFVEEDNEEDEN